MAETSLKHGLLTLDGQSFTSSDLQNLKSNSNVKIIGIRANSTYTIPTQYRGYTFVVLQNGTLTSIQPDSNYQITPTLDSVLIMAEGLDIGNYGNQSGTYNNIVSSTSFTLNYPVENNYTSIVPSTSFNLNYPTDESYTNIVGITSFTIDYPVEEEEGYTNIVSSTSFTVNYPVEENYTGLISSNSFTINYPSNTPNYTNIVPSTSFTINELSQQGA